MFKNHFNCTLWLGILNLPLACFFGLAYLPEGDSPWFVLCTFFFALIGQLFVYFAIISIIFILPAFNWRKKIGWPTLIYATCIMMISHGLLNLDAVLYENYGEHLFAYLRQVNAQERIIDWAGINWMHFGMLFVIILGYSSLILAVARVIANHRTLYWPFVLVILVMYFLSSGIFVFAQSRNIEPIMELESKNLPKFIDIRQMVNKYNELQEQENEPVLPPAQYEPDDGSYIQPSAKWDEDRTETIPSIAPEQEQEVQGSPESNESNESSKPDNPKNNDSIIPEVDIIEGVVANTERNMGATSSQGTEEDDAQETESTLSEVEGTESRLAGSENTSSQKASGFGIATDGIYGQTRERTTN